MIMDASGGPVKRRYDASRRRERADRRRATVVGVAERRFLRDGYTATTIAGIAAEAGVSPDTIYKSFGGKPGLVRAIRERALRGDATEPAEIRSERVQAAEQDPRAIIRAWGAFVAEI